MYAKLQNNALLAAPRLVQRAGSTVINPGDDILLALGYLPVQYTDPPAVDDGCYAVPRWTQTDTAIVQEWTVQQVPYDDAVNAKIRERYTESQEFAILRQRDEKPDEYAQYYSYCEECKAIVKSMQEKYKQ